MTMLEVMVPGGEQNGAETKFESFTRRGRSVKIEKEWIETMFSETSMSLPVETVDWNRPNPNPLAVVTLHEWQTFTQQCKAHPTVSPEFPSLTIKVEGRSLDLYLGEDGREPENIGMLYMETSSGRTATELEKDIEMGLIHPRMLESEKLRADDTFIVIYFEWFEDTATFEPYKWEAIGKALHHRITTGSEAS